ncbi:MAG: hypothetical protein KC451_16080 [Amylibacter sp.]|jgi:hypothetical protein|nr:hypothetical protein [Amylibacter sp.]
MNLWPHIKTKSIALVGVAVFLFFNVPLPFLFGPLFARVAAPPPFPRLSKDQTPRRAAPFPLSLQISFP